MKPVLFIVIPCYNEEKVLPITSTMFLNKINELVSAGKIADSSRILFVNDGSKDHTAEVVQKYVERYRDSIRLVNKKMEDMVQQSILVLNMLAESIIKF